MSPVQRNTFTGWTDSRQANERMAGGLFRFAGSIVYVREVSSGEVTAESVPQGDYLSLRLNDEGWGKFRTPPPTGWFNSQSQSETLPSALHVSRLAVRTRSHGLTSRNVSVSSFDKRGNLTDNNNSFSNLWDKGYLAAANELFPSLEGILEHIRPLSSIAYSSRYCVRCDKESLKWLYRGTVCIGMFYKDSLKLLPSRQYLIEELTADPLFTLEKIQEF